MILTENKTGNRLKKIVFISSFLISYIYLFNNMAIATAIPNVSLNINTGGTSTDMSDSIELLLFFTLLSVLPSILIMMTCFTRIVVILSFLKQAIGAQQTIPSQVMVGLALFLTFFIMAPVGKQAYDSGLKPYFDKQINQEQAVENVMKPVRVYVQTNKVF